MQYKRSTAKHKEILSVNKEYFYENESRHKYQRKKSDPRLIALYLPQFHPIPENDKAWGKGFTEWTNVKSAKPRFIGHKQPFLPLNQNYYDLRDPNVLHSQIDLAKQYGIYGFCFYHYWFSGKSVLDTPLNIFLQHKEWDFNFMICWANENWTKRWDGKDEEVIIAQQYKKNDPLAFIKSVEKIILDPRYIRNNGKPILMVYRASDLKDPLSYSRIWREYFRLKYSLEIELVTTIGFDLVDPRSYGFDKALDFQPLTYGFKKKYTQGKQSISREVSKILLDKNYSGNTEDYRNIVLNKKQYELLNFPNYKTVMPSWDNDARRRGKGFTIHNSSPDLYAYWLKETIINEYATQNTAPLIFINAWNEWGEGAVLEPTEHFGYANLIRTAEVLSLFNNSNRNSEKFPQYRIKKQKKSKLAIVLQIPKKYDKAQLKKKLNYFANIDHEIFFVTSKTNEHKTLKKDYPNSIILECSYKSAYNMIFTLHLGKRLLDSNYRYLLNIAGTENLGFDQSLEKMLPNKELTIKAYNVLKRNTDSAIGIADYSLPFSNVVQNETNKVKEVLVNLYNEKICSTIFEELFGFGIYTTPSFWIDLFAIRNLLNYYYLPYDFLDRKEIFSKNLESSIWYVFWMLPKLKGGSIYKLSSSDISVEKFEPNKKHVV